MPVVSDRGLFSLLGQPFKDEKFRQLLRFLGTWSFAVNFAAPFFTVYLIVRLGLSMTWVIGLTVLSQLVYVLFLQAWGRLADRFSNKSVLAASGPLFMISVLLWPFTTMPETYFLTIPLLILIHVLAGMSNAGVTLCAGNIALKAAPRGSATTYLATNALVSGLAATAAPILAGFAGDWFANKRLNLAFTWSTKGADVNSFRLPALDLSGLDFLFVVAFVLGLYALHRLLAVKEEGEVEEKVVLSELYGQVRTAVRQTSTVAGVRYFIYFPYVKLREALFAARRVGPEPRSEPPPNDPTT